MYRFQMISRGAQSGRSGLPQLHHITPFPTYELKQSCSRGCEIAESPWLTDSTKTDAGAEDTGAYGATKLKWEFDEALGRYYVSFPDDQQWSPVGAIGDLAFGVVFFSFELDRSRSMSVF